MRFLCGKKPLVSGQRAWRQDTVGTSKVNSVGRGSLPIRKPRIRLGSAPTVRLKGNMVLMLNCIFGVCDDLIALLSSRLCLLSSLTENSA
jgi:hypothetical protein